jgi:hypothetical protein
MFAGVNARLDRMAAAAGYRKIDLRQVLDGNNAPVFDVFRIVSRTEAPSPAVIEMNKTAAALTE